MASRRGRGLATFMPSSPELKRIKYHRSNRDALLELNYTRRCVFPSSNPSPCCHRHHHLRCDRYIYHPLTWHQISIRGNIYLILSEKKGSRITNFGGQMSLSATATATATTTSRALFSAFQRDSISVQKTTNPALHISHGWRRRLNVIRRRHTASVIQVSLWQRSPRGRIFVKRSSFRRTRGFFRLFQLCHVPMLAF